MKNDLTCGVVQDLLPSYVEGLTSPESNTAVERHLSGCPDCAQLRAALAGAPEQAAPEDTKEVDYLKKVKRRGWRRVVPSNCPIKMVANVGDLASSVERVGLIVSEKYKSPVRCVFGNQELQMRTNTTIGAAEDRCSLAGDGQELEIGFNVRYLAEALRVIPSEEVTLELTNGLSPIVLTPVDEKEDFAYMVLPVRIKNG